MPFQHLDPTCLGRKQPIPYKPIHTPLSHRSVGLFELRLKDVPIPESYLLSCSTLGSLLTGKKKAACRECY